MDIKHYIKEHESELTFDKLYKITCKLSKVVDNNVDEECSNKIKRKIHCIISEGHYNEEYALHDVKNMYYEYNGEKHYASYWSVEEVMSIYNSLKSSTPILSTYNFYDFYVTLNMIKSDNYKLYKTRFKGYSESELDKLFIEDTINWLDDADNPFGTSKIWKYINK